MIGSIHAKNLYGSTYKAYWKLEKWYILWVKCVIALIYNLYIMHAYVCMYILYGIKLWLHHLTLVINL
jgi:hypothetical protein